MVIVQRLLSVDNDLRDKHHHALPRNCCAEEDPVHRQRGRCRFPYRGVEAIRGPSCGSDILQNRCDNTRPEWSSGSRHTMGRRCRWSRQHLPTYHPGIPEPMALQLHLWMVAERMAHGASAPLQHVLVLAVGLWRDTAGSCMSRPGPCSPVRVGNMQGRPVGDRPKGDTPRRTALCSG